MESFAYGINNMGEVVGYGTGPLVPNSEGSAEVRQFSAHAYKWPGAGALEDLGHLGKNESFAYSINDNGTVVGRGLVVTSAPGATEVVQTLAYRLPLGGEMQRLPAPSQTISTMSATSVAQDEHVVGYALAQVVTGDNNYYSRGFIWSPVTQTTVLIPSLEEKSASGLRDVNSTAGKAVGYAVKNGQQVAIQISLSETSTLVEIGGLGGVSSAANAINSQGVVVGGSFVADNSGSQGFIYHEGTVRSIGLLDHQFTYSSANDINDEGLVVGTGQASRAPSRYHAVVFDSAQAEAVLVDLNAKIDCADDLKNRWVLTEAVAVNNNGHIIGYGAKGGITRAFLLTPSADSTPPIQCEALPSDIENKSGGGSAMPLGLVLSSLMIWMRRRKRRSV
ncbi:MAG: hypothetical protein ACK4E7_10595 [Permianibacter sp.]